VGLTAYDSGVGSFEQQNGHQTYKMTDDLRALCGRAGSIDPGKTSATDLGAVPIRITIPRRNNAALSQGSDSKPMISVLSDDLGAPKR
jgi:hypothetical protein